MIHKEVEFCTYLCVWKNERRNKLLQCRAKVTFVAWLLSKRQMTKLAGENVKERNSLHNIDWDMSKYTAIIRKNRESPPYNRNQNCNICQ